MLAFDKWHQNEFYNSKDTRIKNSQYNLIGTNSLHSVYGLVASSSIMALFDDEKCGKVCAELILLSFVVAFVAFKKKKNLSGWSVWMDTQVPLLDIPSVQSLRPQWKSA